MTCNFSTIKNVFRLWKSLFRQAWPILVISCIIGSVYTVLDRGGRRSDNTLSIWWWFTAEMNSLTGFGVIVIWPFRICGWISTKWALALFGLCEITDLSFRIAYWNMEHLYAKHIISDYIFHLYLGVWALLNDLNSWVWVPFLVYLLQYTNNKSRKYRKNSKMDKNKSVNVELSEILLTPTSSMLNDDDISTKRNKFKEMKSKLHFNKDLDEMIWSEINKSNIKNGDECDVDYQKKSLLSRTQTIVSSVTSTNLTAQSSFSRERKVTNILKYSIIFCIVWFLCEDVYEYWSRIRSIWPRFLPLIFVLIGLIWDLQRSFQEKQIFFHSFWYIIGYILIQNLFSAWAALTISLVASASNLFKLDITNWIENSIVRMIVFLLYSLSFQLITFIGRKFAIHSKQPNNNKQNKVQWDNFNSFDLQFIFMVYSDYFLFQFITLTSFNLTFFATLMAKQCWNLIKLHPKLRKKSKIFSNNPLQVWFAYVYGILISWIVLICQLTVIYADYFQPFNGSNKYWLFGNNDKEKTVTNLILATIMIFITLFCDMIIYLFTYKTQRKNLKHFTKKIQEIKEKYNNNNSNDNNHINDEYFDNEFDINNIRIKTIDHERRRTMTIIELNHNDNNNNNNDMFITLDDDDDDDDDEEEDIIHIEKGVTIRKNTYRMATGLGLYIPFHLWYYTFVSSLVAIRCTEIIFTDLYNYFI